MQLVWKPLRREALSSWFAEDEMVINDTVFLPSGATEWDYSALRDIISQRTGFDKSVICLDWLYYSKTGAPATDPDHWMEGAIHFRQAPYARLATSSDFALAD